MGQAGSHSNGSSLAAQSYLCSGLPTHLPEVLGVLGALAVLGDGVTHRLFSLACCCASAGGAGGRQAAVARGLCPPVPQAG